MSSHVLPPVGTQNGGHISTPFICGGGGEVKIETRGKILIFKIIKKITRLLEHFKRINKTHRMIET
jgi:hypothetical protein